MFLFYEDHLNQLVTSYTVASTHFLSWPVLKFWTCLIYLKSTSGLCVCVCVCEPCGDCVHVSVMCSAFAYPLSANVSLHVLSLTNHTFARWLPWQPCSLSLCKAIRGVCVYVFACVRVFVYILAFLCFSHKGRRKEVNSDKGSVWSGGFVLICVC